MKPNSCKRSRTCCDTTGIGSTYAQDLAYEPGIHGRKIGSDAASIPLPDGSVSKIALHCSFEHFESGSDSGFIREAARLLKPGGKVVIVPLYLAPRYAVLTDPLLHTNRVSFEPDALIMAVKGWGNRHGRFYDAAHLPTRVLSATPDITFSLNRLVNRGDLGNSAYAQYALMGVPRPALRPAQRARVQRAMVERGHPRTNRPPGSLCSSHKTVPEGLFCCVPGFIKSGVHQFLIL